jgi:hypothetical protein
VLAPDDTVRLTGTVSLTLPLVPVTVSGYIPTAVLAAVFTVSPVACSAPTAVGLKLAEAPVGRPVTARPAVPVKPFKGFRTSE